MLHHLFAARTLRPNASDRPRVLGTASSTRRGCYPRFHSILQCFCRTSQRGEKKRKHRTGRSAMASSIAVSDCAPTRGEGRKARHDLGCPPRAGHTLVAPALAHEDEGHLASASSSDRAVTHSPEHVAEGHTPHDRHRAAPHASSPKLASCEFRGARRCR